ncbi:MAG: hypothetical protein LCH56_14295 [Proteobacteria bacterium]|nr:hypothetical protein [Pseudomonadota bacterium]
MSDDIPIIFTEDLRRQDRGAVPTAVFFSAGSTSQMQQYATAGWRVIATPGFRSDAKIELTEVPAETMAEASIPACTLLSCEAKFLPADTAAHIRRWQPGIVKFNCAFYDISDASGLAQSVAGLGYIPLAALWRDDNSFGYRAISNLGALASFPNLEWDRTNLIAVRDAAFAQTMLSLARLYVGEERRIQELRVANAIRNDYIARLEDALQAYQKP